MHLIALLREMFSPKPSVFRCKCLSESIYLPFAWWCFGLPSILGEEKMYFPSVPVINFTSCSSTRLPSLLPFCNTGAGLCRLAFPLPAGWPWGWTIRTWAGRCMAGRERRAFFSPFPVSVFQSGSTQTPQWCHRGSAGCPWPPALGTFILASITTTVLQAGCSLTQEPPLWDLRPAGMQALYSWAPKLLPCPIFPSSSSA